MLSDLIERVKKLTGPCRETDALVCAASGYEVRPHGGRDYYEPIVGVSWQEVPSYTASLDAAVALTERLLPGADWKASVAGWDRHWADISGAKHIYAEGTTPALALILATLRAYAVKEGQADG